MGDISMSALSLLVLLGVDSTHPLSTQAHGPIGITIAVLAGLQLLTAFFLRPKPDGAMRRIWNLQVVSGGGRVCEVLARGKACFIAGFVTG